MKQLTKAEEEVMQVLWELEKSNVAAIIDEMPAPKPAYNTVSTIASILESHGLIDYEKKEDASGGWNQWRIVEMINNKK